MVEEVWLAREGMQAVRHEADLGSDAVVGELLKRAVSAFGGGGHELVFRSRGGRVRAVRTALQLRTFMKLHREGGVQGGARRPTLEVLYQQQRPESIQRDSPSTAVLTPPSITDTKAVDAGFGAQVFSDTGSDTPRTGYSGKMARPLVKSGPPDRSFSSPLSAQLHHVASEVSITRGKTKVVVSGDSGRRKGQARPHLLAVSSIPLLLKSDSAKDRVLPVPVVRFLNAAEGRGSGHFAKLQSALSKLVGYVDLTDTDGVDIDDEASFAVFARRVQEMGNSLETLAKEIAQGTRDPPLLHMHGDRSALESSPSPPRAASSSVPRARRPSPAHTPPRLIEEGVPQMASIVVKPLEALSPVQGGATSSLPTHRSSLRSCRPVVPKKPLYFSQVRLRVTGLRDPTNAAYAHMGCLQLLGKGMVPIEYKDKGFAGAATPTSREWRELDKERCTVTFHLERPSVVHGYRVQTGDSDPAGDPIAWELSGTASKKSNSVWILLHVQRTPITPYLRRAWTPLIQFDLPAPPPVIQSGRLSDVPTETMHWLDDDESCPVAVIPTSDTIHLYNGSPQYIVTFSVVAVKGLRRFPSVAEDIDSEGRAVWEVTVHPAKKERLARGTADLSDLARSITWRRSPLPQAMFELEAVKKEQAIVEVHRHLTKIAEKQYGRGFTPEQALQAAVEADVPFIDLWFLPQRTSLYRHHETPPPEGESVTWGRPADWLAEGKSPELFIGGVEPNDIQQGALGDHWLMCVMSSLAEVPETKQTFHPIRSAFLKTTSETFCRLGAYILRLVEDGWWRNVIIDDYLPLARTPPYSIIERPAYSTNVEEENEMWVAMLQKGMAKLKGSYAGLKKGTIQEGFADICGLPTVTTLVSKAHPDTLIKESKAGYLIVCRTPSVEEIDTSDLLSIQGKERRILEFQAKLTEGGLSLDHAYCVMKVHKLRSGEVLVQMRNPWPEQMEWGGGWGDADPRWTPELRAEVGAVLEPDGTFWMGWDDVLEHFHCFVTCVLIPCGEVRLPMSIRQGMPKTVLSITTETEMTVWVGVHQKDTCSASRIPEVGDWCRAKERKTGKWFPALVTAKNPDGSYSVDMDCGTSRVMVPDVAREHLAPPKYGIPKISLLEREAGEEYAVVEEYSPPSAVRDADKEVHLEGQRSYLIVVRDDDRSPVVGGFVTSLHFQGRGVMSLLDLNGLTVSRGLARVKTSLAQPVDVQYRMSVTDDGVVTTQVTNKVTLASV